MEMKKGGNMMFTDKVKRILRGAVPALTLAAALAFAPLSVDAATATAIKHTVKTAKEHGFDADYYYANNPDVARVFGKNDKALFKHYLEYGIKEGRSASAEFNLKAYKEMHKDLAAEFGEDHAKYAEHYQKFGKTEGRKAVK